MPSTDTTEWTLELFTDSTPYTLRLAETRVTFNEDGDFEDEEVIHSQDWEYDGEWHPPAPPHEHDDEDLIYEAEDKWREEEAPWLAVEAVSDALVAELDMEVTGFSNKSEARYLTHEDSEGRVRVAAHDPVYESSQEAFNILIGVVRPYGAPLYAETVDLPLVFTDDQLAQAVEAASAFLDARPLEDEWDEE